MTIDVFGNRVYDDVCAMVQRVLYVRAKERVIYNHHDTMLVCYIGNCAYINQTKRRVAGRFNPYQLCFVWANKLCHVYLYAGRKSNLNAMGLCDFGKVTMRPTVDI